MWRVFPISLVLLFAARAARASENYPDVIRSVIPTNQALPCTLCHTLTDGGDGAVTTAFGREMLDFGMKGGDPASLRTALRRNAARAWDSDGDGVPDIEELVYGSDPSSRALSSGPPLMHGCTVGAPPPPSLDTSRESAPRWHLVLFALVAGTYWFRRHESTSTPKMVDLSTGPKNRMQCHSVKTKKTRKAWQNKGS